MAYVKPIDLEQLEKLGMFQVTVDEIAAWFKVDQRTVRRWMKRQDVLDAFERGKANGRISLRQAQFKAALGGNPALLIWMGKQLLNQKDQIATEHSGEVTLNDREVRDKIISRIIGLAARDSDQEGPPVVN